MLKSGAVSFGRKVLKNDTKTCWVLKCDIRKFFASIDQVTLFESLIPQIAAFLGEKLKLSLHPDKVFIKTLASGVDFLGWVHFSDHRVMRTASKRKMFKKLKENEGDVATKQSYLGLISHGNAHKLVERIVGSV